MKFIIYNPFSTLFDFFINSLIFELNKNNLKVFNYIDKETLNFDYLNDIIMIIINPHYLYDYKEIELEMENISKNFKFKILYISEPINFIIEKNIYNKLIKQINPYCLWTYTFENFNKVSIPRKTFKIFPQNKSYQFIKVDLSLLQNRNIKNIIFFGNMNENRIPIGSQFNNLINITSLWSIKDWSIILNQHLFYLNIHRRKNCKAFESFRIIPILSNGGVIFSERCNEKEENIYNKYNIIFCEKNNLYNEYFNYIQHINYENIYKKYSNYINDFNEKNNMEDFIDYHRLCTK